jgi:transitional endoplasmic reticulum ATPase
MTNYYQKLLGQILIKLIASNQAKYDNELFRALANQFSDESRKKVVIELFDNLIRFQQGQETSFPIFKDDKDSKRAIKNILSSINILTISSELPELFYSINNIFYEGELKVKTDINNTLIVTEDEFVEVFDEFTSLSMFNYYGIKYLVLPILHELQACYSCDNIEYPKTITKLVEAYGLDNVQKEILLLYGLYYLDNNFENLISYTPLDFKERKIAHSALAKLTNLPSSKVRKELRSTGKLCKNFLFEINDTQIYLANHIGEFLLNDDESVDVFSYFFEKIDCSSPVPLINHNVEQSELHAINSLLKTDSGVNVLLYGAPGTGKSEFAKGISKSLDYTLLRIKNHDDASDFEDMQKIKITALMVAKNILPKNSILLVDEAESMLMTDFRYKGEDKNDYKAWLNTFLEDHQIKIIWITNDLTMHESTKRRFDIALKFDSFTRTQRLQALKRIQQKSKIELFTDDELLTIANDFQLDPGALSLPFAKAHIHKDKDVVMSLIKSQYKFIKEMDVIEKKHESIYNPKFINTTIPEEQIFNTIESFYNNHGLVQNLCVLFQGRPGTGKTEYAKYLSEKLEKKLNVKRASDILDPYVGMTERKIAHIFQKSEKEGDILFLDECDSLFINRESAERSWMVSQTNEFLTQMERFKGILICATNFVDNLDHAAMRRFHLKIKFDELKSEHLVEVYQSYFKKLVACDLSQDEVHQLQAINGLTPGDFKAVYNAVIFQPGLTHQDLIDRLKNEISYKKSRKPIRL